MYIETRLFVVAKKHTVVPIDTLKCVLTFITTFTFSPNKSTHWLCQISLNTTNVLLLIMEKHVSEIVKKLEQNNMWTYYLNLKTVYLVKYGLFISLV